MYYVGFVVFFLFFIFMILKIKKGGNRDIIYSGYNVMNI